MVCRVKQLTGSALLKPQRRPRSTSKSSVEVKEKYLEKTFTNDVIQYAQDFGWRVAHFPPIQASGGCWLTAVKADGRGWPDLVFIRGKHIVVAELKTESQLGDEQILWLEAFQDAGVRTYVWIPEDWEAIKLILAEGPK